MKNNILRLKDCYGCGVCVMACPVKIISLEPNKSGFYSPVIHQNNKCIECGCCLDVCSFNHENVSQPNILSDLKVFGGWSSDPITRARSTSAGVAYEISKYAISLGENVVAVKYDKENENACHYVAKNMYDIEFSQGTKYIPSFTQAAFTEIDRTKSYTVFGLPCQIDSFRRYIKRFKIEHNFKLVDLFCYGVPSTLLWHAYLEEKDVAVGDIESVKFRSKINGWHKSALLEISGTGGKTIEESSECNFYKIFFSNGCLNKCCYKSCKYKLLSSAADIRLGDFWGPKYRHDDLGVNLLITFSELGETIVNSLKECKIVLEEATVNEAVKGQMSNNAPYNIFRPVVLSGLRNGISLKYLSYISRFGRVISSPKNVFFKFDRK